jgi:hypothetical protein
MGAVILDLRAPHMGFGWWGILYQIFTKIFNPLHNQKLHFGQVNFPEALWLLYLVNAFDCSVHTRSGYEESFNGSSFC